MSVNYTIERWILRVARFLVNWLTILTMPLWVWPVFIYCWVFEEVSDKYEVLTGKKWFWRNA